jgi:hypothetical protein
MASSGQEICFCLFYYLEYKLLLCLICQKAIVINRQFKSHLENYIKERDISISLENKLEIINKCQSLEISSLEESYLAILNRPIYPYSFRKLKLLENLWICQFKDCLKVFKSKVNIQRYIRDHFKRESTSRNLKDFYKVIELSQSLGFHKYYFRV